MIKINFQKDVLPHLVAVVVFLVLTVVFFKPVFFEEKTLVQSDIVQWQGSAQELMEYRDQTGKEGLWTNSIFGGMPAYLISVKWGNQLIKATHAIFTLGLQHPVRIVFASMLSFYIMLLCFKVRPYLALIGAIAFGLSSYNLIGITAGHNARISAVSFMPLVMGGVHLCFTRNKILGASLTALALAMQLRVNHLQITYYLAFVIGIYGLIQLIYAIREKEIQEYLKRLGLLLVALVLAIGTFFGEFYATYEYGKYSNRGSSELSQQANAEMNADGLGKTYAFQYSNGIWDPATLFIPNALGGSGPFPQDGELSQFLRENGVNGAQLQNFLNGIPTYWGQESATTYYAGAVMVFLFVLGLLLVERKYVIWLASIALLGIILSYGRNMPGINNFLFDYFPGYNKFRSVSFTIVLPIFSISLLGMLALEKLLTQKFSKEIQKKLLIAFGLTGGLALLLGLGAGALSYRGAVDSQIQEVILDAVRSDRKALFRSDALRAFGFIAVFAALLYLYAKEKISNTLAIFGLVIIASLDVTLVSSRFLSDNNFNRATSRQNFTATPADQYINQNEILGDRVLDLTSGFYNGKLAYHHHLINGYHGARIRRYQELIDNKLLNEQFGLGQSIQAGSSDFSTFPIINMLNTKFLITNPASPQGVVINNNALGNAWFVSELDYTNNTDEEFNQTLTLNDPKTSAVVNSTEIPDNIGLSTAGNISLTEYHPGYWKYESSNSGNGFAVFSEIHYPKGFEVTIDGQPVDMLRANYILRALSIPAGNHVIEFKFVPKIYTVGSAVMQVFSVLTLLVFLGSVYLSLREKSAR
ncbi:YfhO family protein [Roseivirga sp. E12]|uniref:YfhO family protein n=1 Tax=Roseivirga sp. E12 TaxID=2819237 RepID=UPI001ABCD51C|nr:YfhO family protein [Roseivirga sp. E12]MBO3697991.1 YfhO family protein [Roseivirga sp. E12]